MICEEVGRQAASFLMAPTTANPQFQDWFSTDDGLLRVPCEASLAERIRLSEVRRPGLLAHRHGTVDVQRVLAARTSVTAGTIFERTRTPL